MPIQSNYKRLKKLNWRERIKERNTAIFNPPPPISSPSQREGEE